jgi:predicted phosphodiesterase
MALGYIGLVGVSVCGILVGLLLAGRTTDSIGPFEARYSIMPAWTGGTRVDIPPLGSLQLRSHQGPAELNVALGALDQKRIAAIVKDPNGLARASDMAVEDVSRGVRRLVWQVAGVSVLGAMLLGALVYRSTRQVAACGGIALGLVAVTGLIALATFRADSIAEPRYEGLLTNAPAVVGDARRIANRFTEYRAQLQRLVGNVGRIYGTLSTLPVYQPETTTTTRVLHVSDLHLNPAAWSLIATMVEQFKIDFIVDTGDITDWGSQTEASYVATISTLKVPYVYVRGNHDSAQTTAAVARQANAIVLDNTTATIHGITIAGIADPQFTPDKTTQADESLIASGDTLAAKIRQSATRVDIAMVHDPEMAQPLGGVCPLVLAGHLHHREVRFLDTPDRSVPATGRSLLMVQGSTGGAGLRGLEFKEPTPLALSVLYFDASQALQAYDDITVGGTGETKVSLQRNVVRPDPAIPASPSPATTDSGPSGAPTPSGPAPPGSPTQPGAPTRAAGAS